VVLEKKLQHIDNAVQDIQNLFLTGNAYRGIGMNDCTREGYNTATNVIRSIEKKRQ